MNFILVENSLFVIGSLIFTGDCLMDVLEEISLHSLLDLLAGLMFTIGSLSLLTSTKVQ